MYVKVDGKITDYEKHIVSSYNLYYAKFCIVNLIAVHLLRSYKFMDVHVSYSFPILEPNKARKLKFQHHYLTTYSWLL